MATLPLRTAPLGSSFPFHQAQSSAACENISISEHCQKLLEFDWYASRSAAVKAGFVTPPEEDKRAGQGRRIIVAQRV